jgi:hypothetical protein
MLQELLYLGPEQRLRVLSPICVQNLYRATPATRVSSKQSKIFFRFELKQTKTQSVLVVFQLVPRNRKTFFGLFRFVSVFRTGNKTTETEFS